MISSIEFAFRRANKSDKYEIAEESIYVLIDVKRT